MPLVEVEIVPLPVVVPFNLSVNAPVLNAPDVKVNAPFIVVAPLSVTPVEFEISILFAVVRVEPVVCAATPLKT